MSIAVESAAIAIATVATAFRASLDTGAAVVVAVTVIVLVVVMVVVGGQ
jgi:hypothetical protein